MKRLIEVVTLVGLSGATLAGPPQTCEQLFVHPRLDVFAGNVAAVRNPGSMPEDPPILHVLVEHVFQGKIGREVKRAEWRPSSNSSLRERAPTVDSRWLFVGEESLQGAYFLWSDCARRLNEESLRWYSRLRSEHVDWYVDTLALETARDRYFTNALDAPNYEILVERSQQVALAKVESRDVTAGGTYSVTVTVLELWKDRGGEPRLSESFGTFRLYRPAPRLKDILARDREVILFLREPLTEDIYPTLADPLWGAITATEDEKEQVKAAVASPPN